MRLTIFSIVLSRLSGILFCVLTLSLLTFHAGAQVSTYYTFSQSLQAYKSDTSTVSTVPASIFSTGWDDNTYTAYKFPFNFTYNGVLYTGGVSTIGLDTDGWMAFSTTGTITMTGTTGGGSWVSISNSTGVYLNGTANNNGICGFNSDLEEQAFTSFTGNITTGSSLVTGVSSLVDLRIGTRVSGTGIPDGAVITAINSSAATIRLSANATATTAGVTITPRTSIYAFIRGIAPYRQFVIQWTRATRYNFPGDDFTFQIVLNEGGGDPNYQTLQAVYGICKATNTTAQNAQVGLRGASAADFNARKTTTDWSATTAATANTDVCTLTPSVFPASGLTYTWSPACLAVPSNAGSISGPLNVCPGTIVEYSIPGVPGAIYYNWTYTGSGVTLAGTSTLPVNALDFSLLATGGTLTVTPGNLCGNGASSSIAISISALPSASISYPLPAYCTSSGVVNVTRTGPSGGTFTASPAGLSINSSTGQVTPASSTPGSYTITYNYVSGCAGTATTTMVIDQGPALTASATPPSVCSGQNTQLLANSVGSGNYTFNSIPHASLAPSGSPTVLYSSYTLDAISAVQAMPFTFNFYGQNITQFYVSTEGYIQLQTGTAVSWTPQFLPNATNPNNIIAMAWDDLVVDPSTNTGSSVRYFINGTSPNRVLVIDYINLRFLAGSGAQQVTGQIRLYESDNHIEVALTTINDNGASRTKTLGIENNTGTLGLSPVGRNQSAWNTGNEAWAFYPPTGSYTYSWSPSTFLSSTSIANPVATAVTAATTYTVTVTNSTTGCSSSVSVPVTIANVGSTGSISGSGTVCPGTSQVYSIPAVTNATTYTWTYSGTGVSFSSTTATPSNTFVFSAGATAGTITVTPSNTCGNGSTASLTLTVTSITPASISYPSASVCTSASGTIPVNRTGPSGGTYSTNPSTGLTINASTGAITPSSSTSGIYTVIYTYTSGSCGGLTATATVTVNAPPTVSAAASPATVCPGSSSQLTATVTSNSNYTLYSIAHNSLTPTGSPTVIWNTTTDDAISSAIAIPFTFNFYGSAITQLYASTNGHIQLQTNSGAANTEQTLPNASTPNNLIALAWDDLVVDPSSNPGSTVRYFVNGTSPNRVMVIDYINLRFYSGSGQTVTGQIRLYESDSHIEIAATTVNDNASSRTKTMGIENSTGTIGLSPAGRNNVVWNVSNEAWAFYPPSGTFTYAWTPATFLSNAGISNPVASGVTATTNYTVTATNTSTGCAASGSVTLTYNAGLSGTYTVGAGGNYTTLTAAINAYNTQCISGPILFSLIDNAYSGETYPIVINSNASASAVNTLTIKPAAGKTPVFSGSSSTALIKLNGADYVTIDGSNVTGGTSRNLTLINTNTGTSTTSIIWICSISASNGAINNTVKNCIMTGNSSTTTNCALISSGSVFGDIAESANSNNTFTNNEISKAQSAIALVGPTGNENNNIISNNLIGSATPASKLGYSGIEIYQQANCQVTGNTIFGVTSSSSLITTSGIAVYGTQNTVTISLNKISDIKHTNTSGYGANGILLSATTTASNMTVVNNMIFDVAGYGYAQRDVEDNGYGIMVDYGGGYKIYNNTVVLNTNQTATTGLPAAFNVSSYVTTAGAVDVRNNIFGISQTQTSPRYAIMSTAANTVFSNLDYNIYFTAGTDLGYIGSNRTTLANVQAGFGGNLNSINFTPVFISGTNYHINSGLATNFNNIANKGTPLSGVVSDFDGESRNPLTPDVGCDEWIEPNKGYWIGLVSTDWMTPANWEANFVPNAATDVFITGGYTYMPTIAAPLSVQAINGLTLTAPGAPSNIPILTIANDTLLINGTITRTGGSIDASNGTVQMNGAAAQTIPANLFLNNNLKNLVVGNTNSATGVTLGGRLDIYGAVTFTASGLKLTTNDNLTFKSNAAGTARLGNVTGKTIVGNATVERYIPTGISHGKSWQFVSVPLNTTQTINQAWQDTATSANQSRYAGFGTQLVSDISPLPSLFDASGVGPSIKTYNPSTNLWDGVPNTTGTAISNKRGYMVFVRGDRTVTTVNGTAVPTVLRAKGKLYTATAGELPPTTTVPANKFESIGNPYASAIDFLSIGKPSAAQVDDAFYVWDPLRYGSWGYGAYQTISSVNGYKPIPGGTANYNNSAANTRIESGQAFLVHATGASSGGNVSFTETSKLGGSQMVFRQPDARLQDRQFMNSSLYAAGGSLDYLADAAVVAMDADLSNEYDHDDAMKILNPGENFGIRLFDKTVALEARGILQETDTIHYWLGNLKRQAYRFRFSPEKMYGLPLAAFLYDRFLQQYYPVSLSDSSVVSFTVTDNPASSAADRFIMVFRKLSPVPVSFTGISAIRTGEHDADVSWKADNETGLLHYQLERSADGSHFAGIAIMQPSNNAGGSATYMYADHTALVQDNYYRVKAVSRDGQVQYSDIARIGPYQAKQGIEVYPNPAEGGRIQLLFTGIARGTYKLSLYNDAGQLVASGRAVISQSSQLFPFEPRQWLAPGLYNLRIQSQSGDGVWVLTVQVK